MPLYLCNTLVYRGTIQWQMERLQFCSMSHRDSVCCHAASVYIALPYVYILAFLAASNCITSSSSLWRIGVFLKKCCSIFDYCKLLHFGSSLSHTNEQDLSAGEWMLVWMCPPPDKAMQQHTRRPFISLRTNYSKWYKYKTCFRLLLVQQNKANPD